MDRLETRSLTFAAASFAALVYLNDGNFAIHQLLAASFAYWIAAYGFSLGAVEKKFYEWLLHEKQRRRSGLIMKPNISGGSAREVGTLPSAYDHLADAPKQDARESFKLRMCNEEGSWLMIDFFKLDEHRAKVDFFWYHKDDLYELAQGSAQFCTLEKCNADSFKASGFHIMLLEPLRRWRILFNGMLRNVVTGEVGHAKMNLIWTPLSSPFDWSKDVHYGGFSDFALDNKVSDLAELEALRSKLHEHGFDQWGAMFGTVSLDTEEKEVYFRGLRERIFVQDDVEKAEGFQIVGVSDHGFHFTVEQKFLPNFCSGWYLVGHILVPGCSLYPASQVECPDLTWIFELTEKRAFHSHEFFIRCQAGGRWFNIGIQVIKVIRHDLIEAEMTFNCHRGKVMISRISKRLEMPEKFEDPWFPINEKDTKGETATFESVLSLSCQKARKEEVSGGKGASLAQMMSIEARLNASIPRGIVLTTTAFENHLEANPKLLELTENLQQLSNQLCSQRTQEEELRSQLQDLCRKVCQAFVLSHLSQALQKSICAELSNLFDSQVHVKRFAVRSSAVGEDSQDLSSAGQNETFLGCKGLESIFASVTKCWASLFSYQSVEYRRQNGQLVVVPMAVVVQEMVDAEAAGVLFSRNPVNGDPSEILITANYGLGESVVSAKSEPDTIIVKNSFWQPQRPLEIASRRFGSKGMKIVMNENDVIEESVKEDEAARLCLLDNISIELAKLAITLEAAFRNPRDTEFAVKDERIYLLQSRPITSLSAWTDFELEHEFDTAISSRKDITSKGNVGEVIPGATSLLSNFIALSAMDASISMGVQAVPGNRQSHNPYKRHYLQIASHHVVFNHQDLLLQMMESDQLKPELIAVDYAVYGHEVTKQGHVDTAVERRGVLSLRERLLRYLHVLRIIVQGHFLHKKGLPERFQQEFFAHNQLQNLSAKEVFDVITERAGYDYIYSLRNHLIASESSSTLCIIIFMIAANDNKDWDADFCCDLADLMVSSADEDVVSAGVPNELRSLSTEIFKSPEFEDFLKVDSNEGDRWLKSHPTISSKYLKFLQVFGHRCLREFDLTSCPWEENPAPLVETLQAMVLTMKMKSEMSGPSAEAFRHLSLDERIAKFKRPLDKSTRDKLKFVLPHVYRAVALREHCKSMIIKRSHEIRLAYRQLASKLCSEGRLPHPDLIFHLTHYEVQQILDNRDPILIQKAIKRQRLRESTWDHLKFPEMIHGIPKPINIDDVDETSTSDKVVGTPVCRGKYKGSARIVTKLSDAKTIQRGDILITISTDIGWSPYFPLLGGVVTELGGLISHGAVVAREYGLPCVVGAEGATKAFKNGDTVIIDGGQGMISKCST